MQTRIWPFVFVLVSLMAGCTDAPAEVPPPAPQLPALEAFGGCAGTYPAGDPIVCDQASPLAVLPQPPATAVCIDENANEGWSFHWDPASDTRGIHYDISTLRKDNETGPVDGVLYVRTDGEVHLYNWSRAPPKGYLEVPAPWGDNVTFRFLAYNFTYALSRTNASAEPATFGEAWSVLDDQFWVANQVHIGRTTYTFEGMQSLNSTRRSADGTETKVTYHAPATFVVDGSDFRFAAIYRSAHFGRSLVDVPTTGFDRDCAL